METGNSEPKKKELTNFLKWLIFVTCLGAFQCGFNMWTIGDPSTLKKYVDILRPEDIDLSRRNKEIHPALVVFSVSSFALGCFLGSFLFGPMADKCGRKGVLLLNDLFSIVTGLALAVSKSFEEPVVHAFSRLFTGFCTGIFSCAVPLYLGEISPTNLRGGIVSMNLMFVSIGMLISTVLDDTDILGSDKGMPFLLSIPAIIAFFQLFLLLNFPESPRYLMIQKGDTEGARQGLRKLRGQDNVEDEIEELRQEDLYERKEKKMTVCKLLNYPSLRWQLVCVLILISAQQFTGMNLVYFYADRIFLAMKIEEDNVKYSSVVLTFLVLFPHGLSVYKIDSWGRRSLLLSGLGICMISCILLIMTLELQVIIPWMAYISSFLLLIFISAIVIGPNAVPYLMITELFLQSTRASAFAIGGVFQWFLVFLVGFLFILVEKYLKTYSFLVFLPFCVISFFYILKCVPETKKKTILDIRKHLEKVLTQKYLTKKLDNNKKKGEKS